LSTGLNNNISISETVSPATLLQETCEVNHLSFIIIKNIS